jgi:CRISPR/Cas system-associated protein Cas10 (large subunit of type III CRISPR-Cas system)
LITRGFNKSPHDTNKTLDPNNNASPTLIEKIISPQKRDEKGALSKKTNPFQETGTSNLKLAPFSTRGSRIKSPSQCPGQSTTMSQTQPDTVLIVYGIQDTLMKGPK